MKNTTAPKILQSKGALTVLLLALPLLFFTNINCYAQQSDMLDFLPAIIAATGGDCDPSKLDVLRANCRLQVETDYNLNSRTITLPRGVKLDFNGGSIRNGTLIFAGGKIDGRLLNASLTIRGNVQLKDPVFKFTPSKWNIREGRVNKAQATANRVNINKTVDLIRRLGAHTMELGKMDAFFEVGWYRGNRLEQSRVSIRIPSNFHFKMSDQTYLRVQPNDQPAYSLLNVYNTVNSTISGGHLAGDRYEHIYAPVDHPAAHEFGSVVYVIGAHDAIVENVEAYHATGEGLLIHAENIRNPDGTLPPGTETTENLLVKGGVFRDNRRNNIAVVDADGVIFDGITVLRAGEGVRPPGGADSPAGVQPWAAIDLEATRTERDGEANKITDITIRNSLIQDNVRGLVVHTPTNVLIEKNTFINDTVVSRAASDVIVQDNTFTSLNDKKPIAINIQRFVSELSGEQLVFDWRVLRNTITGYRNAIVIGGDRQLVSDNKLYQNLTGIKAGSLYDSTISNNIIESDQPNSKGFSPGGTGGIIKNVFVRNETIRVAHRPVDLRKVNEEMTDTSSIQLTIEDSDLQSSSFWPVHVSKSKNILVRNSRYTNDIEVLESENIILQDNELVSP